VGNGAGEVRAGWYHFGFLALALAGTLTAASLLPRTRDQRRLGAGITAVGVVSVLGLLLAPQLSLLWALMAGFCSGGAIVIAMALFGLRTANHHEAAGLSSMAQSIGYLFAAAGPLLVGALRDASGGWTVPLLATLAVLLLQGAAILLAGRSVLVPARPRP
jgi:CP family cyanate transporter-like MFS transporter